ncbi:DUF788-domain-containing protein [Suhomyces tanzawaensis NRRL Y-17324]|uniref:DUF788-domain-containing protein n=1 Tax=Suhomyces tanzawaensis NRRL Y-17324 TaxID=984487 RepID=A0A1E4SI33_9ASCO|nr:DUF788-domain-containing protein [Suhomyces tanzawaensis NRRL Y-17324]ODV79107.1 DUF788-domain-containing protein [Suhomyces tanzawaensis NRRL Y-17324]
MASQSTKKLASTNTEALKQLHTFSLAVNAAVILILYLFRRPANYKPYVIFSIPAWVLEYSIERSGRPAYAVDPANPRSAKLVRAGDDITRAGLYEYFFDTIYVTWIIDVLLVILGTNYVWYLYAVIPAFAGYKVFGFVSPFLKKSKAPAAADTKEEPTASTKSKRQTKLEARREKGPAVKYR